MHSTSSTTEPQASGASTLVAGEYAQRQGTSNFGKDYEIKITALMALRCIEPDVEDAALAFNPEHCSDFDDVIVYRRMKNRKNSDCGDVSLIQLKYNAKRKSVYLDDLLGKTRDFALWKYEKKFEEMLNNNFKQLQVMFHDPNLSCENMKLVLYTTRNINIPTQQPNSIECLKPFNDNIFLKTNLENSKVYSFNPKHPKLKEYNEKFIKNLYFFTEQVEVELVDQLIENEIKKYVSIVDKNIVDDFVKFITSWSNGLLGGHYTLTRTRIIHELIHLLLQPYHSKFIGPNEQIKADKSPNQKSTTEQFHEIIKNFDVILISQFDNNVSKYLHGCLYEYLSFEQNKPFQLSANINYEYYDKRYNDFRRLVSKNGRFSDVYRALWQLIKIPLILVIESREDYLNVTRILSDLKCNSKFIILGKSLDLPATSFSDHLKVLTHLIQLDENSTNVILEQPVKFQGRKKHYKLKLIIGEVPDYKKIINTNDIINILNDTFCVGDILPSLPDVYITRTLPKIILKPDVFQKNNAFYVMCTYKNKFKHFLSNQKVTTKCILFDNGNKPIVVDSNTEECLIVLVSNDFDISLARKLLDRPTHFLNFFDEKEQIQWVKSYGDTSSIKSHVMENIPEDAFYYSLEKVAERDPEHILNEFPNLINIIAAGPGMGKSVAMNVIGLCTPPEKWVLRVDLNQPEYFKYYRSVSDDKQSSEHLKHFGKTTLTNQNCFTKLNEAIFEQFLKNKNVLTLLDGFDEISPAFTIKVTDLIRKLQKDEYSLWLTTRPVTKSHVEKQFNTFSFSLNLFSREDQINYLYQYFKNKITAENPTSKINHFSQHLLKLAEINLGGTIRNLMGVPLQTKMLAEVYLKDCQNYVETGEINLNYNLDILSLYENFVELKKKEFTRKLDENITSYNILDSTSNYHKLYAIDVLFEDKSFINNTTAMEETLNNFKSEVQTARNNVGFINCDEKNLSFVHKTFAEYYAALWLTENRDKYKYSVLERILLDPNYEVVRNFFDRIIVKDLILQRAVLNRNVKEVSNIISNDSNSVTVKDNLGRSVLYLFTLWLKQFPITKFNKTIKTDDRDESALVNAENEIVKLLTKNCKLIEEKICRFACKHYCLVILNLHPIERKYLNIKDPLLLGAYLYYCAKYDFANLMTKIFDNYPEARNEINELEIVVTSSKLKETKLNLLHVAAENGNYDAVSQLVKKGADINIKGQYDNTPLHYAVISGKNKVVKFLLSKEAQIKVKNYIKYTPLHYALDQDKPNIIKLLLSNGEESNQVTRDGQKNILHYAAQKYKTATVAVLLNCGANINQQDTIIGNTPLHYAAQQKKSYTVKLLLSRQNPEADVSIKDKIFGDTALHYAVLTDDIKTVEPFLQKGVSAHLKNNYGNTAIDYAKRCDAEDVLKLFQDYGIRN